jgi:outer membrane protein assembly factor BamB
VRIVGVCLLVAGCDAAPALLDGPTQAIVAEDGLVYVADGYFHARIAVFARDGRFVRDWGSKGFEHGQLQTPHALLQAADGTLVVADRDNGRLQRFTTSGQFLESMRDARMGRPWCVAQSAQGHLFVADGGDQRPDAERAGVAELSAGGDVLRRFSQFGTAPGELDEPHMLAVTATGDVIVAEIGNHRLQRFAPESDCAPEAAGCDYAVVPGWPALDGTPGLEPLAVAVDAERVYVGHQGEPPSIWVLDRESGRRLDVLAEGRFERPHGLFVDRDGTLWVADDRGDRILHLDAEGRVLGTLGEP